MTLEQLCNIGNTPAQPLEIIDPYTNEKTGVTLYVHQVKSRKGSMAQSHFNIRFLELMQNEDNLTEDKKLKTEIIEDLSREMYALLIESWDGIDDEFTFENAISLLKNSTEVALQVANFATNSGKSLTQSKKS